MSFAQVTTGDIVLNQLINTVAGASGSTGAFCPNGLAVVGGISEGSGLVAPAVTARAANAIDLLGSNLIGASRAGHRRRADLALVQLHDLPDRPIQVSAGRSACRR